MAKEKGNAKRNIITCDPAIMENLPLKLFSFSGFAWENQESSSSSSSHCRCHDHCCSYHYRIVVFITQSYWTSRMYSCLSYYQPVNQPTNQSTNQPVNQWTS